MALPKKSPVTSLAVLNADDHSSLQQAFQTAKTINVDDMVSETGEYLKLEEGMTYLVLLKGMTQIESTIDKGAMVDAADLVLEDGSPAVNADAVMVSSCRRICLRGDNPCMLYIFVEGLSGEKGRQYKNLKIHRIPTSK